LTIKGGEIAIVAVRSHISEVPQPFEHQLHLTMKILQVMFMLQMLGRVFSRRKSLNFILIFWKFSVIVE
jgi:hypothetical protein